MHITTEGSERAGNMELIAEAVILGVAIFIAAYVLHEIRLWILKKWQRWKVRRTTWRSSLDERSKTASYQGEWYEVRRVRPGLHKHHIVFGDGLRPLSEKYGLYIYLPYTGHNEPGTGVHDDKKKDMELKIAAQRAFEEHFPELSFPAIFGMNFLPEKEFDHDELFKVVYKDRGRQKINRKYTETGVKNHNDLFGLEFLLKSRRRKRNA